MVTLYLLALFTFEAWYIKHAKLITSVFEDIIFKKLFKFAKKIKNKIGHIFTVYETSQTTHSRSGIMCRDKVNDNLILFFLTKLIQ